MERKIKVVDVTLRDGEQTAGVVFANPEKIRIAKLLDAVGVDQIEAGIPTMGGDEKEVIKQIVDLGLKADIIGWSRAVVSDVQASIDCGVDAAAISISTSDIHIKNKLKKDRQWVLSNMAKAVEFAKKNQLYVSVNAEDASRTDMDFLIEFARIGREAGADRIRYCDTVGVLDPLTMYDNVKTLIEATGMAVETHTHNDFGMATANALAGAKAGATYMGVTVNGLGERAGNASLEEVIMTLEQLWDMKLGYDTTLLKQLSEYVAKASGRQLPVNKAIVGDNVFKHESGIHADGILKCAATYEAFLPEQVGLTRGIIIGKHSGSHAVLAKLAEHGYETDHDTAEQVLKRVRHMSIEMKRSLLDTELIDVYKEYMKL